MSKINSKPRLFLHKDRWYLFIPDDNAGKPNVFTCYAIYDMRVIGKEVNTEVMKEYIRSKKYK